MVTKGYGLSIQDIDNSCPADLEPYAKAHNLEVKENDMFSHLWWGRYGISALTVAIDHCFSKKAKSEYIKTAILDNIEKESTNTNKNSNEEIAVIEMKQRARLLEKQGLMQSPS